MSISIRRLSLLALVGFLLAAGLWRVDSRKNALAQGTAPAAPAATQAAPSSALPATKPVINGSLNGNPVAGLAASSCWPQTDPTAPLCDLNQDPQPTTGIPVKEGDNLVFTVDPASPQPISLQGTLLDDKDPDGQQRPPIDLTNTGGIFLVTGLNAALQNHRLLVSATYAPDAQGNQLYVSYAFLLTISQAAATAPAAAPTDTPPALLPATQSAAPTQAATVAAPTVQAPATQVPPQATLAATIAIPTATLVPPALSTPTPQPTVVPPAAVLPTSTPIPEGVTPAPSNPSAGSTGPASAQGGVQLIPGVTVPTTVLIVEGRSFDAIAVNSCVQGTQGETICINRPTDTTSIAAFGVAGDVAQINFKGPRPTSVKVTLYSSDGTTVINKQTLQADNLVLYSLPSAAGDFVLNVDIVYPGGEATYYFRLNMTS